MSQSLRITSKGSNGSRWSSVTNAELRVASGSGGWNAGGSWSNETKHEFRVSETEPWWRREKNGVASRSDMDCTGAATLPWHKDTRLVLLIVVGSVTFNSLEGGVVRAILFRVREESTFSGTMTEEERGLDSTHGPGVSTNSTEFCCVSSTWNRVQALVIRLLDVRRRDDFDLGWVVTFAFLISIRRLACRKMAPMMLRHQVSPIVTYADGDRRLRTPRLPCSDTTESILLEAIFLFSMFFHKYESFTTNVNPARSCSKTLRENFWPRSRGLRLAYVSAFSRTRRRTSKFFWENLKGGTYEKSSVLSRPVLPSAGKIPAWDPTSQRVALCTYSNVEVCLTSPTGEEELSILLDLTLSENLHAAATTATTGNI